MKVVRWVVCVSAMIALALLSSFSSAEAQSTDDDMKALDAFITESLEKYNVPGASVAVVQDGKVILAKGYGVRDIDTGEPVDENTIFQLASVTKALTGAAAGSVVDEGKLDWDTPITTYLPEFVGPDPYMTRWMTERDLMAMRTGWPAFTGDAIDSFGYDRDEIIHQMRYLEPAYSLRDVAQYSNMGIFLGGEVAARAAGTNWNDLVQKRVFDPLEMTRSGTVVEGLKDDNLAAPHALVDGKLQVVARDVLDRTGAASSGTSTAADMANFMMMLLDEGKFNGEPVLKPETVEEIFKRSMVGEIEFSELPPISPNSGFYYGLGVDSYDYGDMHIIEKAGALSGVRTVFTLMPEKNAGIVILDNMNLAPFPEAVRAFYINQVLGRDPLTDQDKIFAAQETINKLIAPQPQPENPGKFLGTLDSLVGTYKNTYYGEASILLDGETLSMEFGPAKYPATLTHYDNGAFAMLFPGATQAPSIVTFEIGQDGKAVSFNAEGLGRYERVTEEK